MQRIPHQHFAKEHNTMRQQSDKEKVEVGFGGCGHGANLIGKH